MKKLIEFFKYHLKKLYKLATTKIELFIVTLFYLNKNKALKPIIMQNRNTLRDITNFLDEEIYLKNDYGIQRRIYDKLNAPISNNLTYSDLIVYFQKKFFITGMNYLEIGCSVLKNFIQIKNNVFSSHLVCYDINEINPTLKDEFYKPKNNNFTSYFKGDVTNNIDAKNFINQYNLKFDLIFSDALHNEQGVFSEYKNIYFNQLSENFIIYYDDFEFQGVKQAALNIKKDLLIRNIEVDLYQFNVYGWIGEHEKTHINGIITNIDLLSALSEDGIKLYKFKKL